ncbi:MAG: diacylglycerol kinase family lipid kinase [Anaerolineae bacterium]|nr:diacylglycerol kinase family lipid kinase [Anaerolineae bacterium]
MPYSDRNAPERALIVFNPVAGTLDARVVRETIERHLTDHHWTYQIHETSADEDTTAIIHQLLDQQSFSLVVAAGGDGTVSTVADALQQSRLPVGILPVGTSNTLAQELGIPLNLEEACRLLTEEHSLMGLDGMQVGQQIFLLHISIDLVALTIEKTERQAKRRFGRAAYMWTALTQWLGYQPCRFILSVDGQPPRRLRAASVFIANIGAVGLPPFYWGPHIRPDDGLLDICIIRARTFFDYLKVVYFAWQGSQLPNPHITYLTARQNVTVFANRPLPVQGDGEIIGETKVTVKVIPGAIQLVVPTAYAKNSSLGREKSPMLA